MNKKQQAAEFQEALLQELQQSNFNNEVLSERMAELELALEDANWMRTMLSGQDEFSRDGLRRITELARMMFIKNPLINRAVLVQALYVWGQGVNVKYKNAELNNALQAFWDDPKNKVELTSHQAQIYKEYDLRVEGNIFFVFFTRPTDGRVRVRTLPLDEITEIISDPEDAKTPWFYVRSWTEQGIDALGRQVQRTKKAAYPDWQYKPKMRLGKIGGTIIQWNTPVYHVRTGGMSKWKFGVSEIYQAIDWARAYKEFLEDVASLMRAYSRFAWKRVTKGGKKAIAAEKAKMATTLSSNTGAASDSNPPPVTGAMAFLGEGTDLQPMQVRGASISPEDGRRLLLMVAAAVGLPETYFGDVSVGTFATAKTMDRPTELAMKERQTLWTDVLKSIFDYVLLQAVKYNKTISALGSVDRIDDGSVIEELVIWKTGVKTMLDIDFPPILEKDIQTSVQAVITALTLNGQELKLLDEQMATRLILKALAEDDVDEIMTELFPDGETLPAGTGQGVTSDARVKEAARKLASAIMELKHE